MSTVVDMNKARNCTCATCEKEFRFPPCSGFKSSPFKKHSCANCFHLPEEHISVIEKKKAPKKKRATNFTEQIEGHADEINEFLGLHSDGTSLRAQKDVVTYSDSGSSDGSTRGGAPAKISKEAKIATDMNTLCDYFHFDVGDGLSLYDGVARTNKLEIQKLSELQMDKMYYLPSGNSLQLKSGNPPKLVLAGSRKVDLPEELLDELPKTKKPTTVVVEEQQPQSKPKPRSTSPRKYSPPRHDRKEPVAQKDPFAYDHPDRVKRRQNRRDHTQEVLEDYTRTLLAPCMDPFESKSKLRLIEKGREARKKIRAKKSRMY